MRKALQGPGVPADVRTGLYTTGWALAIPMYGWGRVLPSSGGWVGEYPVYPPSQYPPTALPATLLPHPPHVLYSGFKVDQGDPRGRLHHRTSAGTLGLRLALPAVLRPSSPARSLAPAQVGISHISVISQLYLSITLSQANRYLRLTAISG